MCSYFPINRQRRKQVWELSKKHTQKQMAEQLGVSEKTVRRDWAKLRNYTKAHYNRLTNQIYLETRRQTEKQMAGMNDLQRLEFLTDQIIKQKELRQRYTRFMRTIIFVINLDDLTDGIPKITPVRGLGHMDLSEPIYVKFRFVQHGQNVDIGRCLMIRGLQRHNSYW